MTILFDTIVFGPVKSRRFGVSLGMNLLPVNYKYCTFNCVYCECGWTYKNKAAKIKLPGRLEIKKELEAKLQAMSKTGQAPDNITFAGNGEPTIHPEFGGIIDDTIELRDIYFPQAEITVLSNASLLNKKHVFDALNKVENNVLKLDTAIESTFRKLNKAASPRPLPSIIEDIKKFHGNQIVQTLFVRGTFEGQVIDNTTEKEIAEWLKILSEISPKYVMIYPIERDTAAEGLEKITEEELNIIAQRVEKTGIKTKVYY